jgi:hypothetical protein
MDDFSCFKFENTLRFLKLMMRSTKNPMKNLTNELKAQSSFVNEAGRRREGGPHPYHQSDIDYGMEYNTYRSYQGPNFVIKTDVAHKEDRYFFAHKETENGVTRLRANGLVYRAELVLENKETKTISLLATP